MPAGAAYMVVPLAKATGWPLSYILWELPLALLYQLHSFLLWDRGLRLRHTWRPPVDRDDIARALGI